MSDAAQISLAIGGAIVATTLIHNTAIALMAFQLRVPVIRITYGYGRGFTILRIRDFSIGLSPFLFAGWVKFADPMFGAEARSPAFLRFEVLLAGPLAVIAAACILIGPRGPAETLAAWPQLWSVLTDFHKPVDINAALGPTLNQAGLLATVAVVMTKLAAFNLLPLTITSGGMALLTLVDLFGGKAWTVRVQLAAALPSLLVAAAILGVFVVRAAAAMR
jgi:hypothetical protein